MNISLTPELDSYVHEKVQSGMYHSSSEVIREGLRLLKEQDDFRTFRLDQLRKEIEIGSAALDRGDYIDFHSPEEIVAHYTREGMRRVAEKNAK